MKRPAPTTEGVRAHYRALATTYDSGANRACKAAYARLVRDTLVRARSVLELGAGSSPLLDTLPVPFRAACDLTHAMIRSAPNDSHRTVADGQALPFRDAVFDGVFCVNVLEHVPDPPRLVAEAARVLAPGGRFLAVTPNGDAEFLLDTLERLRLKLPEGPHRFLTGAALRGLAGNAFRIVHWQRFAAFPAGPPWLANAAERLGARYRWGFFQYILLERE